MTAHSTLGVLVPTQGAPRTLLERTLRWRELRASWKRAQSFSFPEPGPPLELATLSTTLAVSTSGWHQLVSNPAREGELTTRLPLGNVTSCKGLRRGQRLPPKHSSDKAETGLKHRHRQQSYHDWGFQQLDWQDESNNDGGSSSDAPGNRHRG